MENTIRIHGEELEREEVVEGQTIGFQQEEGAFVMTPRIFKVEVQEQDRYVVDLTIQSGAGTIQFPIPLPVFAEVTGGLMKQLAEKEGVTPDSIPSPKSEEYRP